MAKSEIQTIGKPEPEARTDKKTELGTRTEDKLSKSEARTESKSEPENKEKP